VERAAAARPAPAAQETPSAAPCGACVACGKVARGVHPDVHVAAPGEGSREIKVDETRALAHAAAYRPFEGRWTVLLVPGAERMNEHAADAILKMLEEPPSRAFWVLTAPSPEALLPTIRSRCQALRFPPLPPGELAAYVMREREGLTEEEARLLVRLTRGDVARALLEDPAVLRQEGEAALHLLAGLATGEAGESACVAFVDSRQKAPKRDEEGSPAGPDRLRGAFDLLLGILHDALTVASGAAAAALVSGGDGPVAALARALGPEGAARAIQRVEAAVRALDAQANRRLAAETLLLDLQDLLRPPSAGR
jgi:DNA polymerase-3 subunit delta'